MMAEENTAGGRHSIAASIAWLSTCLLAAGLGRLVDPTMHVLWLRAGCFGLVAAVGLDISARMRLRRKRMKYWRAIQRRCDRSLGEFVAQRDVVEQLRTAVKHLLTAHPIVSRESQRDGEEPRWVCNLRVEVYAVRREGSTFCSETDKVGVLGELTNLSNSGFGLTLEEQLTSRMVIVAILPPNEQDFDLLGEILWCDPLPDGRMRVGGRLLRVLAMGSRIPALSDSTETEEMPAEAAC